MAEALYRKYRPQVFEDVVGQEHVERTLKNAIDQDKVSHAYLFCGPRGTGKTTTARLLAKALLCEKGPTSSPDGTCRECVDIANGTHPDVYELDAASRTGVDNVREEIIGRVNFAPTRGKKKIYIIDEVHMLSTAAFNALLKTLEEPPSHVVFILCTTDPQKVPATIHSRCQRFDFHRLSTDEIVARLGAVCVSEGVEFEGDALDLVAHRAEGGMRNALTALEQLIAFGEGKVTVQGAQDLLGSLDSTDMAEIVSAVGRRDVAACFNWTANYVESGADLAQFARDMAQRIRNIYVMSLAGTDVALDVPDAERRQLAEELRLFGPDRLARLLGVLGDLISELRTAANPRLCFEIALTRMVRPDSDLTLESLAERVEALEAGKSAVATYVPAAVSGRAAAAPAAPAMPQAPAISAAPVMPQPPESDGEPSVSLSAGANSAVRVPDAAAFGRAQGMPMPSGAQGGREASGAAPRQSAPAAPIGQAPAQQSSRPSTVVAGAAAAPAAPSGKDGELAAIVSNPAALQRLWRSVVTAVKKEDVSHGVMLVNVKARPEEDGSGVVVEFPPDNPFAFAMASKPEVQAVISRAFDQVAGMHVPYRLVSAQGGARKAAPSAASTRTGVPSAQQPARPMQRSPQQGQQGQQGRPAPARQANPASPQQASQQARPASPQQASQQARPASVRPTAQPAVQPPRGPGAVPGSHQAPAPDAHPASHRTPPADASFQRAPAVPAPSDDEVPLEAYAGIEVSEDDGYGYGYDGYDGYGPRSSGPSPAPVPGKRPAQAAPSAPATASPTAAPAPGRSEAVDSPSQTQDPASNADDLSKMLSGTMGMNVVFEEVDE